jgi:hypothetical protein
MGLCSRQHTEAFSVEQASCHRFLCVLSGFHQSMIRQFGETDFFNRIGQERALKLLAKASHHLLRLLISSVFGLAASYSVRMYE